ncbi:MAG TPA: GntR family transcriptional regulator [Solirubrobacteraceae bacterium]|nr:GntR family transcriptional regulator [Solirubrobacteraceae bacterium]
MGASPKAAAAADPGVAPGAVEPVGLSGSASLGITVDRDAEIPIGVQLAWALRTRIRDGSFRPGQRLPGLREMAQATDVNVNTVRAVYQRLEQEGLIASQQGSGTFVASTPPPPSAVASIVAEAVREARQTGVDPREVAAALYVSPGAPAPARDDASERRRVLREQIATLERTLVELEANHPGVAPSSERARQGAGPALLDASELERIRSRLVRRLSAVQGAIDVLTNDGRMDDGVRKIEQADERRRRAAKKVKRAPRTRVTIRPASEGA